MSSLRILAPGKVNLCLFLGPTRDDGRHELVTLFESVSLADELLASVADVDAVTCPGVEGPNLVESALSELRAAGWEGPPLRVEISKRIPVAGGMGGGSADAAAVLRAARELAPVDAAAITAIAAGLGADVPSQIKPGVVLGTGAGEVVEHRPALAPHALLIVPSEHTLSTAEVYREADRLGLGRSSEELERFGAAVAQAAVHRARIAPELLVNDLEPAAISLWPPIQRALDDVRSCGADEVLVSGSGPTVVGLFWGEAGTELAAEAETSLQSRYPGTAVAEPVNADYAMPRIA